MHRAQVLGCRRQVRMPHQAHEHARVIGLDRAREIISHIIGAKFDARLDAYRTAGNAAYSLVYVDRLAFK